MSRGLGDVYKRQGTEGGDINISAKNFETSGNIIAAGLNGVGGRLDIEASNKAILYTSNLDASGTSRGGLVRIGGAFQGSNDLTRTTAQEETFINRWGTFPSMKNAQYVFINKGAIIDVASSNGDAGTFGVIKKQRCWEKFLQQDQ